MPDPCWKDAEGLVEWFRGTRNDLEAAARGLVPEVADVLAALAGEPACRAARMSGSGGTCFGLFTEEAAAGDAAGRLASRNPSWWVEAAPVLTGAP
jgi:4-diphosphocytidyl-2-C-methyl-D-erythritol kinase